jgi:hypothetical protein
MKAVLDAWDKPYKPDHPKPPPSKPGRFTENERAILLRTVVDAVRKKGGVPFNIWHKHGLSRIYLEDGSWLSYAPSGVCVYGPDKNTVAYSLRCELGLKVIAKRAVSV